MLLVVIVEFSQLFVRVVFISGVNGFSFHAVCKGLCLFDTVLIALGIRP
jgi:hypothetical protein